jgi:hypothetical protein
MRPLLPLYETIIFQPKIADQYSRKNPNNNPRKPVSPVKLDEAFTRNPTKQVKFAISSTQLTSQPVAYTRREPLKPVSEVIQLPQIVTTDRERRDAGAISMVHSGLEAMEHQSDPRIGGSQYLSHASSRQSTGSFITSSFSDTRSQQHDNSSAVMEIVDHGSGELSLDIGSSVSVQRSHLGASDDGSTPPGIHSNVTLLEEGGEVQNRGNNQVGVVIDSASELPVQASHQLKLDIDMRFEMEKDEFSMEQPSGLTPTPRSRSESTFSRTSQGMVSVTPDVMDEDVFDQSYEQLDDSKELDEYSVKVEKHNSGDTAGRSSSMFFSGSDQDLNLLEPPYHTHSGKLESQNSWSVTPSLSGSSGKDLSSLFHLQSTAKGDLSTTPAEYHPFSESMSSFGITSTPDVHLANAAGSLQALSPRQREAGVGGRGGVSLDSRLKIDRKFASSDHRIVTSSWLEGVRDAGVSGPSGTFVSDGYGDMVSGVGSGWSREGRVGVFRGKRSGSLPELTSASGREGVRACDSEGGGGGGRDGEGRDGGEGEGGRGSVEGGGREGIGDGSGLKDGRGGGGGGGGGDSGSDDAGNRGREDGICIDNSGSVELIGDDGLVGVASEGGGGEPLDTSNAENEVLNEEKETLPSSTLAVSNSST